MKSRTIFLAGALALGLAAVALAQSGQGTMDHGKMNMGNMPQMMQQMRDMMAQMQTMMDEMDGGEHGDHDMGAMAVPRGDQGPASTAFAKANADMHAGMDIEFTGNADVDFASGMIPHHEGAVAMARIVLEHGKDEELRKLAQGIIAAQETEIAFMKDWLARNSK
ncbi:MAG: DUF305 domain-containing protein [Rhizobiaceae bacterium]